MRLSRWVAIILMTLAICALAAGVVMAAPSASDRVASGVSQPMLDATSGLTLTITPTLFFTHPVGLAISKAFSVTYTEVMSLHQSGVGFGVIARAYMTAKFSDGMLTPQQVLALHESGVGWGQIMKDYGVHPGGKGLGSIMSGQGPRDKESPDGKPKDADQPSCPGNSCKAPGHTKHDKK